MRRATIVLRPQYLQVRAADPHLTQQDIVAATGLSLASVRRIAKGECVSPTIAGPFKTYFLQQTQGAATDWPISVAPLRTKYLRFEQQPKDVFKDWLDAIEPLLEQHQALHAEATVDALCILWLLAWISHDRAFTLNESKEENARHAASRYERAIAMAKELKLDQSEQYDHFIPNLKIAHFAPYFMVKAKATRAADPSVRDWLRNEDILVAALYVAERKPYDCLVLRNGLVIASVLEDGANCRHFYQLLTNADPRFLDPRFKPTNMPSFHEDPDLGFFRGLDFI